MTLAISTGNSQQQCGALFVLALIKCQTGEYSAAQVHAQAAQRLTKVAANFFREAKTLNIEAQCLYALGRYTHSMALIKRARDLVLLCGLSGGNADQEFMTSQSEVYRFKSEYQEAYKIQTQLLDIASVEKDRVSHALNLLNISQLDIEMGVSGDAARRNINTASSIFKDNTGHQFGSTWCQILMAALDLNEGNLLEAKTIFQKCLTLIDVEATSYCLERLADVGRWNSDIPSSYTWTVTFLAHSLKLKRPLEVYKALQFLGDVYLSEGSQNTASTLFKVALDGFTQMDVHRSRAECMVGLGNIAKLDGDALKAADLWKAAKPLFMRSSQGKQVADIEERLVVPREEPTY
jgi:tetratricopeptide (TPR) repeat protein